jgi:hypothetical protein
LATQEIQETMARQVTAVMAELLVTPVLSVTQAIPETTVMVVQVAVQAAQVT